MRPTSMLMAMLMPMVVVGFSAIVGAVKAEPVKWRAVSVLEGGSSHTCGSTMVFKFDVEIDGNIVRTRAASGAPSELKLLSPLKSDGSGKVVAMNGKNREVTLDFDAGVGPRVIRYIPPYSVCVWSWHPV